MYRRIKYLIQASAFIILMACSNTTTTQAPLAGRAETEATINCFAFSESYGRYIKPHYPDLAKKYAEVSTQNIVAATLLQATFLPGEFSKQQMAQSIMEIDKRLTQWDNYFIKADAAAITKQANECNSIYTPKLSAFTQKLRADPKNAPLFKAFDSAPKQ